jgi:hypothetical protein
MEEAEMKEFWYILGPAVLIGGAYEVHGFAVAVVGLCIITTLILSIEEKIREMRKDRA